MASRTSLIISALFLILSVQGRARPPAQEKDPWWQQNSLGELKKNRFIILDSAKIPTRKDETFSKLLLSKEACKTFYLDMEVRLLKQYRPKSPNPWESLWLFWDFRWVPGDVVADHQLSVSANLQNSQKDTQYFLLKPSGWEWGRAFGEKEQDFYMTYSGARWPLFGGLRLIFSRQNQKISVRVNHQEWSWRTIQELKTPGHIGFYVEDAKVWLKLRDYTCSM